MGEPTAILARSHQVIELNSEFSSYQADKPEHTYVWMKLLGPNSEVSQFHGKLPNHYLAALVAGVNKFSIGLITRYEYRFDDATYDVKAGDAATVVLHGAHGLFNNSDKDLELMSIAVALEKGKYDGTDLGDDLTKR